MKSSAYLCSLAILFVTLVSKSESFLFNKDTNCSVSNWEPWGAPFGFRAQTRTRAILRHATGNGTPCPTDLIETRNTTTKPSVNDTATSIKTNFIKRQGRILQGKSVGVKRDLLVIIDSSGSIGSGNFKLVKDQISRLLGFLCPVPDPFAGNFQKAALVEYSSIARDIFDFNDKANTHQIQSAIKSLPYMGQSTCTATAFRLAGNMLTPARGMRTDPDVVQEVLILTDGQSNCGGSAILEANKLKSKATVFGLMIGSFSQSGEDELLSYVSGPANQHIFAIQNFQDLRKLVDLVEAQLNQPGAPPCAPFDI